jgi:hypothetical protein
MKQCGLCLETTQGISLYSYRYLKLAKTLFFLLSLCFLFNKTGEHEDRTGVAWKRGVGGEVAQIM